MADPDRPDGQDEVRRQAALDRTTKTYEDYVVSGYADRWAEPSAGMRLAIGERDRWIVEMLRPVLSGLVVDLGCGDGALGTILDAAGVRPRALLGADILERRLAIARERVPWAEFVNASADALPVDDGSASAVVAMTLFSSLTDDWFRSRVAAEVQRILAPDGRLVVYDLRYPSPRNAHVRATGPATMRSLFPGWSVASQTMTVLPPLARRGLAGGRRRYRVLHAIAPLRSHVGMVVTRPSSSRTG